MRNQKGKIITIIIILIVIVIVIYAINKKNGDVNEQLAKCIASKSTLYIQRGCFACKKQEQAFGENYKYLNVVDCVIDVEACADAEIIATPTWVIDSQKYRGYNSIENLKTITGC